MKARIEGPEEDSAAEKSTGWSWSLDLKPCSTTYQLTEFRKVP